MNRKGFYLLVEALVSAVMLISILVIPVHLERNSSRELLVVQKANDLIKVWVMEKNFSKEKMAEDFKAVFPGMKGEIWAGEKKTVVEGMESGNSISVKGFYVIQGAVFKEIRLKVFY